MVIHFVSTLTMCLSAGGETIKNIKEQSCAHVELQRNPPPNTDPNVRIFSLRGTPQQLDKARQLIDERVGVCLKDRRFIFKRESGYT